MNYTFVEPWDLFLPREPGHVIGIMGSGGKTTLMGVFADRLAADGVGVALTTTTRCEKLEGLAAATPAELAGADLPARIFVHGPDAGEEKWGGLTAEAVDDLGGSLPDRVVLAEVDGSAGRPLKIHREGEPVWPARTSLAVVVMGVGAVGARLDGAVHRWPDLARGALAGLPGHTLVTWDLVAEMLLGDGGYLAQVPAGVPTVLALAGVAGQDDSIGLFGFVDRAMASPRLPLVVFCGAGDEGPTFRTAAVMRPDGT